MPFTAASRLASVFTIGILCFAAPKLANLLHLAPTFATVHSIVASRMRATSSTMMHLGMGMLGMSLGPRFVGMASDALPSRFGPDALGYALPPVPVTRGWAALLVHLAARALRNPNESLNP